MEPKFVPDLVVAIDVGSTHSGYAWQWRSAFTAKGSVEYTTNWGGGAPQIHKTSTSLLLKYTADQNVPPSFVAFGHSAESRFANIQSDKDNKEKDYYHLFKDFKMLLYHSNKAGIDERNLLLATEPECAAVYCINLPKEQQQAMGNIGMPGSRFLTVDAGGGTCDLAAVEVQSDGTLKELCSVMGNHVGGKQVNDAFFQTMYDSFEGHKAISIFAQATPFELMTLEQEFEKIKLMIGPEQTDEKIKLKVPKIVCDEINSREIELKSGGAISYDKRDGTFQIKSCFIREKLFELPCILLHQMISQVLDEHDNIKFVVLVGGFSESGIVQEFIRSRIHRQFHQVNVVVPSSPFRAVLTGAVLYGHNPLILKSRISKATYGIATNEIFDDKKHHPNKKWLNEEDNVYRCKDVFSIHVNKGETVALNENLKAQTYIPLDKNQNTFNLSVYESSEVCPVYGSIMYTTDYGCKKIADITVEVPTAEESSEREVSVTMIYGGTQLSVIAVCKHTVKQYCALINAEF